MRSRIPIENKISKKDFARIQAKTKEISKAYIEEHSQEATRLMLMLMADSLNRSFAFGRARLERVLSELNSLSQLHGAQDIEFWAHIEKRCEQLGIMHYLKKAV